MSRTPHGSTLRTLCLSSAPLFAVLCPVVALAGDDPHADAVVAYEIGVDGNPAYADPATALGPPERFTGEGVFPGVVSPFNPPFGTDEIVSIGKGGVLVVRFDTPVTDDPDNPFGIDLLVFGNAFFTDASYPEGRVDGFLAEGGTIEVSRDGVTWTPVPGIDADGLFPTAGYLDGGPYDGEHGTVETDFTRPVDPALGVDDFLGLDHAGVLTLYRGAGGGAGVDLGALGLDAISYVRIGNPPDAPSDIEIDALSDVAPRRPGDANGNGVVDFADILGVLAAWGACPEPPLICPGDLDDSGVVDFADILLVLANWS